MNRKFLGIAITTAVAAVIVSFYIAGHLYIPQDAVVERDVQSVNWGPLTYSFQFFSWIGDAKGFVAEVIVFFAVLAFNRRTWLFAALSVLSGGWYEIAVHLINRPRPTTAQVLQVTEHPGASSYPSGHTIFIVTITVVLMVCLGYRFLRGPGRIAGWVAVVLIIAANGIGRMYTGAHWPTDVLGGLLIGVAWMSFVAAVSSSLARRRAPSEIQSREARAAPGAG